MTSAISTVTFLWRRSTWRSGGGDLAGREDAGGHLVEQRLEQVVVATVDEHDVDGPVPQQLGGGQPAEAAPDDHDPVPGGRRRRRPPPPPSGPAGRGRRAAPARRRRAADTQPEGDDRRRDGVVAGRGLVQGERLGDGVGILGEPPRPHEGGDGTRRQHGVSAGRRRGAGSPPRPRRARSTATTSGSRLVGQPVPHVRGVLPEHEERRPRRGRRRRPPPAPPGAAGSARGRTSSYREASDARWTAPSKAARATATSPTTTDVGFSHAAADPPSPPTATRPDATPPSTAPSRKGVTTDVTDQTRLQALATAGGRRRPAEDVRDHPQHDGGQHQDRGTAIVDRMASKASGKAVHSTTSDSRSQTLLASQTGPTRAGSGTWDGRPSRPGGRAAPRTRPRRRCRRRPRRR